MTDASRTLRDAPGPFRSVLFFDESERSSPQARWILDPRPEASRPDLDVVPDPGVGRAIDLHPHRLDWVLRRPAVVSEQEGTRTRRLESGPTAVSHAAERVAKAIVLATSSPTDLRTLNAWGQFVGASRGALRAWCQAAGVSARSCLDLLRVLRAVVKSHDSPWEPRHVLDVVDQRTLVQLLNRGKVGGLFRGARPSLVDFLSRQRYVVDHAVIDAVTRLMINAEPTL